MVIFQLKNAYRVSLIVQMDDAFLRVGSVIKMMTAVTTRMNPAVRVSLKSSIFTSPQAGKSGFRDPKNFSSWNPESLALESRVQVPTTMTWIPLHVAIYPLNFSVGNLSTRRS